jgi:tRNA-specific 2-thiouridylase
MSGGLDSAVAALLLRDQGCRVVGVTLRLWADPQATDDRSCCSPEQAERAKTVAHHLGVPHLTVDATEAFRERVVEYFVAEYAHGRTPNPCSKCNARLRFGLLLSVAHRLGLESVATGHYARLVGDPMGLARGVDPTKDQSYVLAEVAPDILEHCIFPLGTMRKAEVRALAADAGLTGRVSPESQDICFVTNDDYRAFLKDRLGKRPGSIVDEKGRPLGMHSGTYNYTVGQRKGLGIAAEAPLYVVAIDPERAELIVGRQTAGAVGRVGISDPTVHRATPGGHTTVQVRSQGEPVPAHLDGPHTVVLEQPVAGVAPGQTAVLYDRDEVILGGTIMWTEPWERAVAHPSSRAEIGPVV